MTRTATSLWMMMSAALQLPGLAFARTRNMVTGKLTVLTGPVRYVRPALDPHHTDNRPVREQVQHHEHGQNPWAQQARSKKGLHAGLHLRNTPKSAAAALEALAYEYIKCIEDVSPKTQRQQSMLCSPLRVYVYTSASVMIQRPRE